MNKKHRQDSPGLCYIFRYFKLNKMKKFTKGLGLFSNRSIVFLCLALFSVAGTGYAQSWLTKTGGLTSDPSKAIDQYGALGSGKGLSLNGTIIDAPVTSLSSNGTAVVSAYVCSTASAGAIIVGTTVSGVTQTITATVTKVGTYSISTTANGVTFAGTGTFASTGAQNIVLTATGTPAVKGSNTFTLNTTPNCNFSRYASVTGCYAKISTTSYKDFLCYNLGADTSLNDPHTPVMGLQGAYTQWGKRGPNSTNDSRVDWQTTTNTDTFAAAPTVANTGNFGSISPWDTANAADDSWRTAGGAKTANDPCPSGYRVPTSPEWTGVATYNTPSRTGPFTRGDTQYGSALHYGPNASTKLLTLPAAGLRGNATASLGLRGSNGYYWSSTENGTDAFYLQFDGSSVVPADLNGRRTFGYSLRCIAE